MKISIIEEHGYESALLGLSLSRNRPVSDMVVVSERLCNKDGGHNKFLESIVVWLDITASRYFFAQFSTYRVGISTQSESTMYSLMNRELTNDDFEYPIPGDILKRLNFYIEKKEFIKLKNLLPEGFLQRRIICLNYKCLRNIICQRRNHKLMEWKYFCEQVVGQLQHPELIVKGLENGN